MGQFITALLTKRIPGGKVDSNSKCTTGRKIGDSKDRGVLLPIGIILLIMVVGLSMYAIYKFRKMLNGFIVANVRFIDRYIPIAINTQPILIVN